MKKFILLLLLIPGISRLCQAQWFPMDPIYTLRSSPYISTNEQIVTLDSSMVYIRGGGLEELNFYDQQIQHHWSAHYQVECVVRDTSNTYVYLKNQNYIGRYNHSTQQYENIWPTNFHSKQLSNVDVAPDGKVWALTVNVSKEVAIYDGSSWMLYPYPSYLSYGFSDLKIVNDTLAILSLYNQYFYAFHQGVYDSLYQFNGSNIKDWDVDPEGNIWIAAETTLTCISGQVVTTYDASNTPLGTDKFLHIKTGLNGHIWTAGTSNRLLEFDGASWLTYTIPGFWVTENFTLDKSDRPMVVASEYSYSHLLKYNGSSWANIPFPFLPINNARAIGSDLNGNYGWFAAQGGIFSIGLSGLGVSSFSDSSNSSYAFDINCFGENSPSMCYGTNHGVYGIQGLENAMLPNDTVNCILLNNGTYYIGTNNGLVTFNGIFYNTYNKDNTPLPSNKITFLSTGDSYFWDTSNSLYIGTDEGLAIYENAQWRIIDSNIIPLTSFYVTGALPSYNDSSITISTLGEGLIKVFPQGNYELYNTTLGNLEDDTLYYINNIMLGECGFFTVMGTSGHGIAYYSIWDSPGTFYYLTDVSSMPINQSRRAAISQEFGPSIFGTDTLFCIASPCGGIPSGEAPVAVTWRQQGQELVLSLSKDLQGKGSLMLYDIIGRLLKEKFFEDAPAEVRLDISDLPEGIFLIRVNSITKMGTAKVVIHR